MGTAFSFRWVLWVRPPGSGGYGLQAQVGTASRLRWVRPPGSGGYGLQAQVGTASKLRWVRPPGSGGYGLQAQEGTASRLRWVQPRGSGGYGLQAQVGMASRLRWVSGCGIKGHDRFTHFSATSASSVFCPTQYTLSCMLQTLLRTLVPLQVPGTCTLPWFHCRFLKPAHCPGSTAGS